MQDSTSYFQVIALKQEKPSLSVGLRWKRVLAVVLLIVYQITDQLVLSSLVIYFIITHFIEKKVRGKYHFVSGIQSQLLEVYHKPEYFQDALLAVADRARCQALFLADKQTDQQPCGMPLACAMCTASAAMNS